MIKLLGRHRRARGSDAVQPRAASLEFKLPSPYGDTPWVVAQLAWRDEPLAQGEALRVHAHVDGRVHVPLERREAPGAHGAARQVSGQRWFADALQRAVRRLPARHVAAVTQWRRQGWIDMRVSSAPLDQGAQALVPEALQAWCHAQGQAHDARVMGSRAGVWSGPDAGEPGARAALAWVQLDERQGRRSGLFKRLVGLNVHACAARLVAPDVAAGRQAHTRE